MHSEYMLCHIFLVFEQPACKDFQIKKRRRRDKTDTICACIVFWTGLEKKGIYDFFSNARKLGRFSLGKRGNNKIQLCMFSSQTPMTNMFFLLSCFSG